MATNTPKYNLKKPSGDDFYNIADFNGNMDLIDTALNNKPNKPITSTAGNFSVFDSAGNLSDSGKKSSDFLSADTTAADIGADSSGSSATVQKNLTSHANDTTKHFSSAEKTKLSKSVISDTVVDVVISAVKPEAKAGRLWIKIGG